MVRCSTYAVPAQARRARRTLAAAGVPSGDITLLTGQRAHDVRTELVGGFAGPVPPDAPFGKYAGPPRRRSQAAGGWSGDPDRRRQGTFGDVDVGVAAVCERGDHRTRLATELELRRLLRGASVPREAEERLVEELRAGHAVVIAPNAAAVGDPA